MMDIYNIQYTDEVLQNCTLETYITLLTNVITINLIKIKKKRLLRYRNNSDYF